VWRAWPAEDGSEERADREGEQRRRQEQADRPWQRVGQHAGDGTRIVRNGVVEVQSHDVAQIVQVLLPEGFVQAEFDVVTPQPSPRDRPGRSRPAWLARAGGRASDPGRQIGAGRN